MLTVMTDMCSPDSLTRMDLATLLNEDLSREYSAIITGVAFSKAFHTRQYREVAIELTSQAFDDLKHAIELAGQIDFLGSTPTVEVATTPHSSNRAEMLRRSQEAKTTSVLRYRERVSQCRELGEDALADQLADILLQEERHETTLSSAIRVSKAFGSPGKP